MCNLNEGAGYRRTVNEIWKVDHLENEGKEAEGRNEGGSTVETQSTRLQPRAYSFLHPILNHFETEEP